MESNKDYEMKISYDQIGIVDIKTDYFNNIILK